MAVTLTVSQIRRELWKSGNIDVSGPGAASTADLGTLFHRVLASLLDDAHECRLSALVLPLDAELEEWKRVIAERVYDDLLGPLLTQQAAAYHGKGQQILDLWTAVQSACDFLADLWWEITEHGTCNPAQANWFAAERTIVREFLEPGWSEPVAIVGQIDAVLQIPQQTKTCLLEWKLGKTAPVLDVAQAALYRLLLDGEAGAHAQSSIAIISFLPERHERLFTAQQLCSTRPHLMEIISRLAKQQANGHVKDLHPISSGVVSKPPKARVIVPPPNGVEATRLSDDWYVQTWDKINQSLRSYGAPCTQVRTPITGPSFVRFFVYPIPGVKPKLVLAQGQNLHLGLGLENPPPMKISEGMIGIDVPRSERQSIPWSMVRPLIPKVQFPEGGTNIPVGVDLMGQWHWCDLSDSSSAHLLVVGTPGSGKSQWLRSAVASLTESNTPETLQLYLIDPKQNAFQFMKDSPFLGCPIVVPDGQQSPTDLLREIVNEMTQRNSELAAVGTQNLNEYVAKTGRALKRIVVVCDEFADLRDACLSRKERDELEQQFRRIAQIGRAPGFHLILATQQPRSTILSSSIRSLLPAKVVLRVTQPLESRVAMDENGAESLLGNGDLFYKCIGSAKRLQGPWLPGPEESLVVPPLETVTHLSQIES